MTTATEAAQRLVAALADGTIDELCQRRRVRLLALFGSAASVAVVTAVSLDRETRHPAQVVASH